MNGKRRKKHISEISWLEFFFFLFIGLFFVIAPIYTMNSENVAEQHELTAYQGKLEKVVNVNRKKGNDYLELQDGRRFLLPGSTIYDLPPELSKGHELKIKAYRDDNGKLHLYELQRRYSGEVLISYEEATVAYDGRLKGYIQMSIFGSLYVLILAVPFLYHKCKKRNRKKLG